MKILWDVFAAVMGSLFSLMVLCIELILITSMGKDVPQGIAAAGLLFIAMLLGVFAALRIFREYPE